MRLRRRKKSELNAGFDWREVICSSEESAKAEAERQQAVDDADEAEWIYLKSDKTDQWLARRTPRQFETKTPWWSGPYVPGGGP
jgi:hypothetical protein